MMAKCAGHRDEPAQPNRQHRDQDQDLPQRHEQVLAAALLQVQMR